MYSIKITDAPIIEELDKIVLQRLESSAILNRVIADRVKRKGKEDLYKEIVEVCTIHFNNCTYLYIPFNTPSSKNSRVWTGERFVASKGVQKWWKFTEDYFLALKPVFQKEIEGIVGPLNLEFCFFKKTRHVWDYINPCQTVQDQMVKHGWLTDDDTMTVKPFFGDSLVGKKETQGFFIRVIKPD